MTALSSFLPADVSTGIRNAIDANPSLTGIRWRVSEGPYPLASSPVCLLLQFRNGTAWNTVQAIDPTGRLLVQQAWQTPTLLNSWVNYGAPYANAGYYRDAAGIVRLGGVLKTGTNGTAAFVLPAGYRPAATRYCPAIFSAGAGLVSIDRFGNVAPTNAGGTGATLASLDGVSFRAEQ
jgi:hypothetical protein